MQKGSSAHLLDRLRLVFARKQCIVALYLSFASLYQIGTTSKWLRRPCWNLLLPNSETCIVILEAELKWEACWLQSNLKTSGWSLQRRLRENSIAKFVATDFERFPAPDRNYGKLWQATATCNMQNPSKSIKIHTQTEPGHEHSILSCISSINLHPLSLYLSRSLRYV